MSRWPRTADEEKSGVAVGSHSSSSSMTRRSIFLIMNRIATTLEDGMLIGDPEKSKLF